MTPCTRWVSGVLFPLHERLAGCCTVRMPIALEGSQWWSAEHIEALQIERPRLLLATVAQNAPFSRDGFHLHALTPDAPAPLSNLRHLSLVHKVLAQTGAAATGPAIGGGLSVVESTSWDGEDLRS